MALDWSLATFLLTVLTLAGTLLLRKRILSALGKMLIAGAIRHARATYFVETDIDTPDGPKRVLGPSTALQSLSASVVPMLVQQAVKSIKLKPGGVLPLNPITGQLDFLAPVLGKIASGKKVALEDFLPLILDKAMPMIESMLGGLSKGGKPKEEGTPLDQLGRVG